MPYFSIFSPLCLAIVSKSSLMEMSCGNFKYISPVEWLILDLVKEVSTMTFWICRHKKKWFHAFDQKYIYIFLVFLTFSSRQPFQYHIKLYLYFQHIDCIPSIETNREEWSVTGLSCSHLRLRASTSHPTLMTAPSNFGSFSQWLSIPKTSMSNLWTWKSDQRISKQLQVCRDQTDMQLYILT